MLDVFLDHESIDLTLVRQTIFEEKLPNRQPFVLIEQKKEKMDRRRNKHFVKSVIFFTGYKELF